MRRTGWWRRYWHWSVRSYRFTLLHGLQRIDRCIYYTTSTIILTRDRWGKQGEREREREEKSWKGRKRKRKSKGRCKSRLKRDEVEATRLVKMSSNQKYSVGSNLYHYRRERNLAKFCYRVWWNTENKNGWNNTWNYLHMHALKLTMQYCASVHEHRIYLN